MQPATIKTLVFAGGAAAVGLGLGTVMANGIPPKLSEGLDSEGGARISGGEVTFTMAASAVAGGVGALVGRSGGTRGMWAGAALGAALVGTVVGSNAYKHTLRLTP